MKKIIVSALGLCLVTGAFAQDMKKVQAGLGYQLGFGLNKPTTKKMASNGVGLQNALCLAININLTEKLGFATGVEFDFESLKYKPNQVTRYKYNDTDIYQKEDGNVAGNTVYELASRKYKTVYLTLPTMLMFRMNPLGSITPYGKFGLRTSFLAKTELTDQGTAYTTAAPLGVAQENATMSVNRDLFFLRSSVGLAAGVLWDFSGGTSVFAEAGFYYGFSPTFYSNSSGDKNHLYIPAAISTSGSDEYFTTKGSQKHIALKVGILF